METQNSKVTSNIGKAITSNNQIIFLICPPKNNLGRMNLSLLEILIYEENLAKPTSFS